MTYAGFLQRVSGAIIDGVIFMFVFGIIVQGHQNDPVLSLTYFFLTLGFALLLIAFLTVRYSGTPGNLLLNCQVVDAKSGKPIVWKQALRRSAWMLVTIASFGLGLLWILVNKHNQALHDKLSATVVVYSGMIDRFDESQKSLNQLLSEVR